MWNYAHDASTAAPNTNYEQSHLTTDAPDNSAYTTAPSASAQPSYAAPPAPTNTNIPASAFPTVTKQICTCVAVPDSNAATEQSSPAQQASPAQGSYAAQAAAPSQTTSASQSYAAQSAQTTSSHGSSYGAQGTTGDRVAKAYAANKGNGYWTIFDDKIQAKKTAELFPNPPTIFFSHERCLTLK